jgi:hypothetical protein
MTRYEICIKGSAGSIVADAFGEMTVVPENGTTVISGTISDQESLHSVLARIRNLGLELLWTREVA